MKRPSEGKGNGENNSNKRTRTTRARGEGNDTSSSSQQQHQQQEGSSSNVVHPANEENSLPPPSLPSSGQGQMTSRPHGIVTFSIYTFAYIILSYTLSHTSSWSIRNCAGHGT